MLSFDSISYVVITPSATVENRSAVSGVVRQPKARRAGSSSKMENADNMRADIEAVMHARGALETIALVLHMHSGFATDVTTEDPGRDGMRLICQVVSRHTTRQVRCLCPVENDRF